MINLNRRSFLASLAAGIVAPVIVRPASLMPIKPIVWPTRILVRGWNAYGEPVEESFEINLEEAKFFTTKIRKKLAPAYDMIMVDNSAISLNPGEDPQKARDFLLQARAAFHKDG